MYENFAKFVGCTGRPNSFVSLSLGDNEIAEAQLGMRIPSELRQFYEEVGCGCYQKGASDGDGWTNMINHILSPREAALLVTDRLDPRRPHGGVERGELPFFDMGDRDYLLVNALSPDPNQVLWQDGTLMIASVREFFARLYDRADFYADGPGTF